MTHRLRLRAIDAQIFPFSVGNKLIAEYFEFVDSDYDFCFLPIINEPAQMENRDTDYWTRYINGGSRLAVIHTLDEYWNRSDFNQAMIRICDQCQVVFGYQLPVSDDHPGFCPIFYAPLIAPVGDRDRDVAESIDVCFWGAFEPDQSSHHSVSPLRERSYRAVVLSKLEKLAAERSLSTSIRSVYYWRLDQSQRSSVAAQYREILLQSKLCLSLYGYGYNSFRNAEIFALRRPLLSPMLHHHIRLPEFELWAREELGYFFEDDASDLYESLVPALRDDEERRRKAHNGWLYYQRHCTPRAIIRTIYDRLAKELDGHIY